MALPAHRRARDLGAAGGQRHRAGTHIYTWAADDYVFLLIGVDDQLNRAMLAALPGERAPARTARPSSRESPESSGAEASPRPRRRRYHRRVLALIAYGVATVGSLLALILRLVGADATVTFGVSAVAIGGLAYILGHATEQLGAAAGASAAS